MGAKESLEVKLDSEQAFNAVWGDLPSNVRAGVVLTAKTPTFDCYDQPWWAQREQARFITGVYDTSVVLNAVNQDHPNIFAHVSTEDKKMVAYTPDREAGIRDKQVKTALGRLLRRLYPAVPDHLITAKVEDHEAEVFAEIEWITSPEEMVQAYQQGPSSCMSKSFVKQPHPVMCYEAPGIRLAVLRKKGKISARSLVFEPTPEDKRYIRVYGDGALKIKLEKLGYKLGDLCGAKLKLYHSEYGNVVAPFLDAYGAGASPQYSAVLPVGEHLYVLTKEQRERIKGINVSVGYASSASGYIALTGTNSPEKFLVTDEVTGDQFSAFEHAAISAWNGTKLVTTRMEHTIPARYSTSGHSTTNGYIVADTPTFTLGLTTYSDDPMTRKAKGMVRLSAAHYPDSQEWLSTFDSKVTPLEDGSYIRTLDAILVVDGAGVSKVHHKSALQKEWVKIHSATRNCQTYTTDATKVVKTLSGRKVIPGYHDVRRVHTGGWDFQRNLTKLRVYTQEVWLPRGSGVTDAIRMDILRTRGAGMDPGVLAHRQWEGFRQYAGEALGYIYLSNASTDQLKTFLELQLAKGLSSDYRVMAVYLLQRIAEAQALEYPVRAESPVVETVETLENEDALA